MLPRVFFEANMLPGASFVVFVKGFNKLLRQRGMEDKRGFKACNRLFREPFHVIYGKIREN